MKKNIKKLGIIISVAALVMASGCGKNDAADKTETSQTAVVTEAVTKEAADATKEAATDEATESKEKKEDTAAAVTKAPAESRLELADGEYLADFSTDSTMFRINDMYDGKGRLTVKDGKGSIHIVMPSTKILNLYVGLAEDAAKDGAHLIDHTVEKVTYDDGLTEDANAFDVPVTVLDEEFDLALIGEKGKWYDHKVKVSNPVPADGAEASSDNAGEGDKTGGEKESGLKLELEGGTGKAKLTSPAEYSEENGVYTVKLEWSSPHYDYMIVDGVKYEPVNTEGNSVFEIPFKSIDEPVKVIADTTAMSTPHEIEYTISFDASSIR